MIKFLYGLYFVFYGIYELNDTTMTKNYYNFKLRLYKTDDIEYERIKYRFIIPNLNLLILIKNLTFIYGGVLYSLNYGGKIYLCFGLIFEFILISGFKKNEMNISPLFKYLSLLSSILSI
jgi:hypothetical protein